MIQEEGNNYRNVAEARVERFLKFIKRACRDKEDRINDDASKEEEFQVSKIKNNATLRDQEVFKKMGDGVKVAEKIFKSRKINDCRMQEMKVRFDMIERVQEDAKQKLKKQAEDPQQYKILLKGLITQGLIKLTEELVEIRCLRADEKIVSQVMGECQREFNEICEVKTKITINKANYLVAEDLGGVTLTSLGGRLVCDNTLRARLAYCVQLMLPVIRKMLFEVSDQYLSERRELKKEQELKMRKKKAAA